MKKVFLFFVVALFFAACAPKAAKNAPATTDTATVVADTAAVDTTVAK